MGTILKDLRYGVRMLFKSPGLSLIAVVTFALGIGLTTTVFSIVNGALLQGLPFPQSERLAALGRTNPSQDIQNMGVTAHDFVDWREQQSVFEGLTAMTFGAVNIAGTEGQPDFYSGAFVSANMFDQLRVQPHMGRAFQEGDDRPGAEPVVILGYDAWQTRFEGRPDVIGTTVRANGEPRTVIGVMPEGFLFPVNQEVWLPLEIDLDENPRGEGPQYLVLGRLNDGVSMDQAGAQLAGIAQRLAQEYPESNEGVSSTITPYTERFLGRRIYALLYTMLGAGIGVLLIASANVANLLLARASTRTKEVAVKTALGASRSRVIMQLLTETLVLALVGGTIGMGLGYLGVEWWNRALSANPPPFWMTFEIDTSVLLFVLGVTLLASLFAGIAPALQATGADVNEVLKDEGRGSSSFRMSKFSSALVVTEIALSCGLLIAAGLMVKSIVGLKTLDLPFAVESIFTARLSLPEIEYPDSASRISFYDQLLPGLQSVPGVLAATLSDGLPASGNGFRELEVEGETYEDDDFPRAREGIVTPGYFDTFETPVLQGRAFTMQDRSETLPVAVLNATFASNFFPDGDAMGSRIRMISGGHRDSTAKWLTVIGIVPDLMMQGIGNDDASPAGFYIPIAQSGVGRFVSIAVRAQGDPMSMTSRVQEAVASLDPNLPLFRVLSMSDEIERQTRFYTLFGTLFMLFGFVAMFLGAVGLYGVMSFAVSRRTQEMGVRMALGAQNSSIIQLVMRKGLMQLGIGLTLGIGLAMLLTRPLDIVLYDVNPRDPVVFITVIVTLALTGLLASFIPAKRATRVDPVVALRPAA